MEKIEKIKELVVGFEADVAKFYNQNNSAVGTRIRRVMQDLKILAGDIRKEITEKKAANNKLLF